MQARIDAAAGEHAETAKNRAAGEVDNLADAADAIASSLSEHDHEGLAEFARRMSDELSTMAGRLQSRNIEDLVHDARELARNNPSMFLFGSVAIGFGLARFLKASDTNASAERPTRNEHHDAPRYDRGIRPAGQPSSDENASEATTIRTRYPDE